MDKDAILRAAGIDGDMLRELQVGPKPLFVRFHFSLPVAQRFSDLTGIKTDLEAVEKICGRLIAEKDQRVFRPEADLGISMDAIFFSDALFAAAVVRFLRTHQSGARCGIPAAWVRDLPPALRAVHEHIKAYRDKFIAHAVAPLEDNQVFVCVQVDGETPGTVTEVNVDHGRLMSGGGLDAFALMQLAKVLRAKVESEIEIEAAQVLAAARAMPVEDIIKRGSQQVPVPSTRAVSKGRKKFIDK
ncbi:hypothetical protein OH764_35585 (plasmid) [Burkholderia sp. M6-3]